MKKRILSLLLAIVMVLGMMPVFAMAEEAATTEPTVYAIDFKQFAKDISAQTWWNDLATAGTDETRWIGWYPNYGYEWDETKLAAYDSMIAYQQANYDWYINETATNLKNPASWKGMFINYADAITWGVSLYSAHLNNTNAEFAFTLNVDKAGMYQMDMTAFYEGLTGAINTSTASGQNLAGSGYVDLAVNGTTVLDDYKLFGVADEETLNVTKTTNVATVALSEGENTIVVRPAFDLNGAASSHRRHINLQSLTFTEVDCTHENVTNYYCDVCGELVTPDGTYFIDFKHFAKAAAAQTWWADMRPSAAPTGYTPLEGAWTGYFSAAMTETEAAAYDSMIEFMKANYNWYLDEAATGLKTTTAKKGFWMANDSTVTWGFSFFSSKMNEAAGDFAFKVNVAEAGYYDLDMTAFYEGLTGATKINFFTGGNDAGAGYVDILVNGQTVLDDFRTYGHADTGDINATLTTDVANVYLTEGENTITVRPALDCNGATGSHRRYINLQSMELNYIGSECPHEVGETSYICDICGKAVLAADSMEIGTEAELLEFAALVNAGASELNATLTADIALTEAWITNLTVNKAIGTVEAPYAGIFDGAGYTVSGLNMTFSNVTAVGAEDNVRDFRLGLFGTVSGATIKNLTVEGTMNVTGRQSNASKIGGLVAYAENATIENCVNKVAMTGKSSGGWQAHYNVGGIAGYVVSSTITKCANLVDITVDGQYMGGLIGTIAESDTPTVLSNSYNIGNVDGIYYVGGLVGWVGGCTVKETPNVITDCYSTGDFNNHYYDSTSAKIYTSPQCGGLFGSGMTATSATNTYTTLKNLLMTGGTQTTVAANTEPAITKAWPGSNITTRTNLWYLGGQGFTGFSNWSTGVSAEDLATVAFAEQMGDAYVLLNDGTAPVLEWQCEHEIDAVYVANGDVTHDYLSKCVNCSKVESVLADNEACSDTDANELCDLCGGSMTCLHLNTTTVSGCNDDYATHGTVTTCDICGTVTNNVNDNCTDEDADDYCDVCGGLLVEKTYTIATADDLVAFATLVNHGASLLDAVVTADIDMSAVAWVQNLASYAIGTADDPYEGTFDGAGYTISGLTMSFNNNYSVLGDVNGSDAARDFRVGLFGTVENATIKNITVEGTLAMAGRLSNECALGGVAARATDTTFENCVNAVVFSGRANSNWSYWTNVGGIVGYADGITMSRCANIVDQKLSGCFMGGLIGSVCGNSTITESYNTGNITGNQKVGGLIGSANVASGETLTVTDCYSTGDFNAFRLGAGTEEEPFTSDSEYYTYVWHAGLIDQINGSGTAVIENCYVSGSSIAPAVDSNDNVLCGLIQVVSDELTASFNNNYHVYGEIGPAESKLVTESELATVAFAKKLGDAYVLVNDGASPVMEYLCEHDMSATGYVSNGDDTHSITDKCADCSKTGENVTGSEACVDEDSDLVCDLCCGAVSCGHVGTGTAVSYVDNGDGTHVKTVTCECGEDVSTETEACADEDADGYCDGCEAVVESAPVIEKFSIAGANMTLGNELEMNVMFPKTAIDNAGTELTAYVTHYSETGDVVHTFTEFDAYGSSYYKLSFRVAAAQMTDTIAVEFKDADGNVYNNEYTNSVRNYVMNNIGRFNTTIQTLMVDMLNYGAAAQDQFTYHQDAYANALLSEEQKALATGDVEVSDLRVKGTNYAGSTLSLEDRILLNIVFNGKFTADELATMSATVSFDNALDGVKQTHENATITAYGSSRFQVTVDQIVLADSSQPVTVTVYNADGTEYGSAVDSVSSYIYRMDDGTNPMYSSIMKFATSALAYGQSK